MPETLHTGNAVIAAKNGLGQILWSWHIWVPSSAVTSSDYGLEDQVWMDRNLGAIDVAVADAEADVNASSFGLFYAWGRKDPFPGLASLAGSAAIATTNSIAMNGSLMSVSASYAAPTTFVSTGSDKNYVWTEDDNTGLWAASKTINDPCPPGYVVPQFKDGVGLWKGSGATGFAFNTTHKWYKAGTDPYIVFPIVGFLDACQSSAYNREYGNRTLIWSSTNTGTNGLSYALRVNKDGSYSNAYERQARGFSVRCVAE